MQWFLVLFSLVPACIIGQGEEWRRVCTLENSRGRKQYEFMHSHHSQKHLSSSSRVRMEKEIMFRLENARLSWWQLPLTVLNNTQVIVRISRQWALRHPELDGYIDATIAPKKAKCQEAVVRKRKKLELTLRMDTRQEFGIRPKGRRLLNKKDAKAKQKAAIIEKRKAKRESIKALKKSEIDASKEAKLSKKWEEKYQEIQKKKHAKYAPKFPPPEAAWDKLPSRLTVRAVLCAHNGTEVAHVESKTTVVPGISDMHKAKCDTEDPGIEPRLPPPNSAHILDAILDGAPEARELAVNASKVLAGNLIRRGVLCDNVNPCRVTVLHTCPICDETRAKADETASNCLFAAAMAGLDLVEPSLKKNLQKNTNQLCVRICVNRHARDNIFAADVSKGNDARDQHATPCRVIHLHGLAAWYRTRSKLEPFAAEDNLDHIVAKGPPNVTLREWLGKAAIKGLPKISPVPTKSLHRCAVVGSGHTLRCGAQWGHLIDSSFDAVFRVNKIQFEPWTRSDFICRIGVRTDFVVNAFGGEKDDADGLTLPGRFMMRTLGALGGAAVAKAALDYANQREAIQRYRNSKMSRCSEFRDYMAYNNFVAVSPPHRSGDDAKSAWIRHFNDRYPVSKWPPVYIPTKFVASRVLGSGSGSTALALALTMCHSVDLFGFGVYKGRKPADFRYLHYYQSKPYFSGEGGGAQVLNSELRNHIYDAFGVANFIWY